MRSIFPLLRGQISFYYFCDTKLFAKHDFYSNFPFMLSIYIYARHGLTKKGEEKDEKHIGNPFRKHPKMRYKIKKIQLE